MTTSTQSAFAASRSADELPPTSGLLADYEEDLCWIDGFMVGVAMCPQFIPPKEWLHRLVAEVTGHDEDLGSDPQLERVLCRKLDEMKHRLRSAQHYYVPIFMEFDPSIENATSWADGFLSGMHIRFDAWRPLLANPELRPHLAPIILLPKTDEELRTILKPGKVWNEAELEELRLEMAEAIPEAIVAIHRYSTSRLDKGHGQPGRNDPCPCGSGRKYKKCCLG